MDCRKCGIGPLGPAKKAIYKKTHRGRGLCTPCYFIIKKAWLIENYPMITRNNRANRIEDFCELAAQGYDRETIAERLKVKLETLDRMLYRSAKQDGINIPSVPKRHKEAGQKQW